MSAIDWNNDHILRVSGETEMPGDPASDTSGWRKRIEPWLSAVFQAEHLSLLLGNGFSTALSHSASVKPAGMDLVEFGCPNSDKVLAYAKAAAKAMGRGEPNIEDQLSAALTLLNGLRIIEHADTETWKTGHYRSKMFRLRRSRPGRILTLNGRSDRSGVSAWTMSLF